MTEIDIMTLELAIRGNALAFRRLYAHYSPFVWRLCYRSSNGDPSSAQEIMQNAFVKVHRYLGSFKKGSAFSTWLYSIVYNCVREFFAKKNKHESKIIRLDGEIDNSALFEAKQATPYEDAEMVALVLAPLSKEDRFLITAREVDGLSYEELAVITGIKDGALRTRLTRLKADIRDRFKNEYPGLQVKGNSGARQGRGEVKEEAKAEQEGAAE